MKLEVLPLITERDGGVTTTEGVGGGTITVTVALEFTLPPGPAHESMKVFDEAMPAAIFEPETPVQPIGVTLQLSALSDDQVTIVAPPAETVVGETLIDAVGAARGATETVARLLALPPGPVQVIVYVVFAVSAPVAREPLVPVHPLGETEQEVALADDHTILLAPPETTLEGDAPIATIGAAGGGVTVTVCQPLASG